MTFRVGQKVVAVKADLPKNANVVKGSGKLTIGTVYTVREIDDKYIQWYGEPGIRVEEFIVAPVLTGAGWVEPCSLASWFRPAVERKTDISIFTRMLNPSQEKVTA